ncbi:recombinase family protein [Microvirga calopogonii]|uniref:recombinase family protein n=1 Tax=Microvirga calopogonii TaxID=2078013 RepID=UPI000E0DF877|nr:recombinase family protein [Microvirga calopogonii]
MREKYVGFYWTFPIQWAGFTHLSSDAEEAEKQSKTIRYQRKRIMDWVSKEDGDLIKEFTFLETRNDRGTEYVREVLDKAIQTCIDNEATLVYIEFRKARGPGHPRRHQYIANRFDGFSYRDGRPIRTIDLTPDPVDIDGQPFNPVEHFRHHKDLNLHERSVIYRTAASSLREIMTNLPDVSGRYAHIATTLNELGIKTPNAKQWTAANVKKTIQRLSKIDRLIEKAAKVPESPNRCKTIARLLEEEGVRHYSGQPWTEERVEKALAESLD